jgi:phosphatidate cytidylyltransferase
VRTPEGLPRRLLTAAVLLGAFLAALFLLERRLFAGLIGLVLVVAGHEWGRLAGFRAQAAALYALAVGALYAGLILALEPPSLQRTAVLAIALPFWMALAPAWLWLGMSGAGRLPLAAAGAVALSVAGLAAMSLTRVQLLLVLGLIWIADAAAYFAGHALGRHKLAPRISPGKTWEGVAGAAAGVLIYAIICAWLPGAPLGAQVHGTLWLPYLAGAVLLCGVGIVGDLFESALKRRAGAKDSGFLLPGHGGVLDRLDSVMPTLPIAAMLLHWMSVP